MIIIDNYTLKITNNVATIIFGSAVVFERIHRIVNLTQKEVIYNTETNDLKTQASLEGGVLFTFGITPKNLRESDLLAIEYIETSGGGGGGGGDASSANQVVQTAELVAIKNAVEGELEVSIVGVQTTSFVPDPKNFNTTTKDSAKFDSVGNLKSRSAVFTDEGSFRYDFEGVSLTKPIAGTISFSNTTETVLGVGTLFLTELQKGLYIKVTTDIGSFWRQVLDIVSDTELLIDRPYPSATSGSVCHYAWVSFNQGTGATITNANSVATMALGTSASTSSRISRSVDYPAVVGSALISVSQRIANQDVYIGFSEQSTSTAKYFAWFRLNGTNAQSIILETCGVKEGVPTAFDIEAQTITLPAGLTTANNLLYRIEVKDQRVRFFINDTQVGRDFRTHISSNYDVLGWGVVGVHGVTPPASNTNVNIDYYNVNNSNEIAIYNPSLSESFLAEQPYFEEFSFNQTGVIAVNTDVLVIDCSQYRSLSIQCTSMGTSGVITPQWTNDPTLALPSRVTATLFDQAGAVSTTFNTAVLRVTNVMARYLVLRLTTATTAGTTNLIVNGSHFPTQTFFGTQPVNGTVGATKSGTWALDAGTNLMGDVGVQYRANATGASSRTHLISGNSTNPTVIKASAGRLIGWNITNTVAIWRYVKLHNQTTAPTAGVGVVQTIAVPPNSNVNYSQEGGIAFTTGIAMTTVQGVADGNNSSVASEDLIIDIFFA